MKEKNPYTHIKEIDEICLTFQDQNVTTDLMKIMKMFPLILKD